VEHKSQENISLLELIKQRMEELGYKAEYVAKKADVPKSTLSRFLNGSKQIKLDTLLKLLLFLDLIKVRQPNQSSIQVAHINMIPNFKNKEIAKNINQELLEIEQLDEESLSDIYEDVQAKKARLLRLKGLPQDNTSTTQKKISNQK
jgi:predicted transcriptional regulator